MALPLAADSALLFGDFGESIQFRVNAGATSRIIKANINREPLDEDGSSPYAGSRMPTIHVMVRNDSTNGVGASEVVNDKSEVKVAMPVGGDERWRKVLRILRQNAGCLLLEVKS